MQVAANSKTAGLACGPTQARPVARPSTGVKRVRVSTPVISAGSATPIVAANAGIAAHRFSKQNPRARSSRCSVVAAAGSEVYDAVVVGAGVSGLTTALSLHINHSDKVGSFLVTEARERVGGNITSMSNDEGYVWEEGPNSFQPNDFMLQIAVDAGCDKDLVFGDPKAPRFVFWDGKLRATPSGPDALTFDLLSLWGKLRAGLGAIGVLKSGPMPAQEESVAQFIRRNLGEEVYQRLIEPFCSGVYAGDPTKLSMKAAFPVIWNLEAEGGSLVGGAIQRFRQKSKNPGPPRDARLPPKPKGQTVGSFRSGLKTLPEAIQRKIGDRIRTNWKLAGISRTPAGLYELSYETPSGRTTVTTRTVVLTTPSYVAAELLGAAAPKAREALNSFDYPPVAAVTLAYPLAAVRDERKAGDGSVPGFGQLHPRTQGIVTLGTIYSSSLFPGRAPAGEMMVLNYIGGATNRAILDMTQDQLVQQVDKDIRKMLIKPDAPAPRLVGCRVWPRAIPQFNIGHMDTVAAAKDALAQAGWDGVLLGGNYVYGVALGKCVEYGYTFAKEVAAKVVDSKVKAGKATAAV